MSNTSSDYAFRVHLDMPMEAARLRVNTALKDEGFGVLTEADVQATLKKKLDMDFRKYQILGVCNPTLAHQALSNNLDVGLLLPCNIILYEDAGATEVAILDPRAMLGVMEGLDAVAEDARARLQRVASALAQ
jgi:uncharacterized protein (DUF302 family)